jgi:hypothetical protein
LLRRGGEDIPIYLHINTFFAFFTALFPFLGAITFFGLIDFCCFSYLYATSELILGTLDENWNDTGEHFIIGC